MCCRTQKNHQIQQQKNMLKIFFAIFNGRVCNQNCCSKTHKKIITHILQGIDGQFAWFSVTDPQVNVYDLSRFPFVWVAQYLWSKELIIMPIGSFFNLASNLPDPGTLGKDVIMLFNTARQKVFFKEYASKIIF